MKDKMPTKVKKSRLYFVVAIVIIVSTAVYLLQRPFVPTPMVNYKPNWSQFSLEQLPQEIEKMEKNFPNLKKDCDKKIGFIGKPVQTPVSFVYIPGFTATRKEIFPVVESLAKQFSANYFLTRFPAHGEGPLDYKNITAQGFFDTAYEALEIGTLLGKKKVVVGTSTGGALAAAALAQGADIAATVLIAPAFAIYPTNSWLLSTRAGPVINSIVTDEYRKWTPGNPAMELYWNTSHHRDGLIALLQAIEYVRSLDFSKVDKPVLMLYTKNDDAVINDVLIAKFAQIPNVHKRLVEIPSSHHVLAGEFTSPETTEMVIKEIHDWLQTLDL